VFLNADPHVAIVILNWNGRAYLQQFLPSVLSTTYSNYSVIVADNASTDDSITFLKAHYPQVVLLKLEQNFGFAKGYNEALKKIEADYYVLLNSDVEVTTGWLQPMIALLQQDRSYAACQPKVLTYKQKDHFEYAGAAGGWIDAFGYPFARGRVFDICELDKGQYNNIQEVFWASGAALLIRSTAFHELKGFDEAFFAHQEEIDLCWRLQLRGYKIFCCATSVVYHVGGGTLPRGNSRKTYLNFRNNLMMLAKNLHPAEAWWKLPFRISLDLISAGKGFFCGDGGYFAAILRAHGGFYKWLFTNRNTSSNRKHMRQLTGVYPHNIAWHYFIKKKRTFSAIVTPAEDN
jgi:GT2 family glycosyltransferase